MNFVFYDTEATGPDPEHDQMLSVAAVLTGEDFVPKDSLALRCRLRPHQLPAAEALLLTGWSIDGITDPSLPSHAEMMRALNARFASWRPAVFAGYSSFEFDEPLLARSLVRCLLPEDVTWGARLDLQRLALGLAEFAPGAIAFTARLDGSPSFRLADVARANGLPQGRAHDAMGDVETTIAVARLMAARCPWAWSHLLRMAVPEQAADFTVAEPVRLLTEFHHNRPHHWLVTALGRNASGDVIVYDLAHDPAEGRHLDGESLLRWLRRHPRPLRTIDIRKAPFVMTRSLSARRVEMDAAEADRRAAMLGEDAAFRARLLAAQAALDVTPQQPSDRDAAAQLLWEEDPGQIEQVLRDELESELAERMLAPETSPWMTLDRAFDEADRALDGATDADASRIEGLLDYLRKELAWAEARSPDQNRSKANS